MILRVTVAAALPREQRLVEIEIAQGATAWDAVLASGVLELYAGTKPEDLAVGIWSRVCARETPVREGSTVILLPAMAGGDSRLSAQRTSGGGSGEPGGSPGTDLSRVRPRTCLRARP